ncbi:hypothetical protein D3C71_2108380 [compost metagenome]
MKCNGAGRRCSTCIDAFFEVIGTPMHTRFRACAVRLSNRYRWSVAVVHNFIVLRVRITQWA